MLYVQDLYRTDFTLAPASAAADRALTGDVISCSELKRRDVSVCIKPVKLHCTQPGVDSPRLAPSRGHAAHGSIMFPAGAMTALTAATAAAAVMLPPFV